MFWLYYSCFCLAQVLYKGIWTSRGLDIYICVYVYIQRAPALIVMYSLCASSMRIADHRQSFLVPARRCPTERAKSTGCPHTCADSHPRTDAGMNTCTGVVDVVLIPEVPFELESLLEHVAKTLDRRGHVVICTAEGAGQVCRRPQCCTQFVWAILRHLAGRLWHCALRTHPRCM